MSSAFRHPADTSDRDPFLPTSSSTRSPRPSPSASPFLSRLAARRGRAFLLLTVPAVFLVYLATRSGEGTGIGRDWGKEQVAHRLNEGWAGLRQHWDGIKSWGNRENGGGSGAAGAADEMAVSAGSPAAKEDEQDDEERFLGYLPHSGFHNQRSALANALFLGLLLNRTVLLPPAWIGWPAGGQYYEDLQQSWTDAVFMHPASFGLPSPSIDSTSSLSSLNASTSPDPLFHPASYPSTTLDYPSPTREDPVARHSKAAVAAASKAATYRAKGWAVRPDGYPDVPGMTEEECKSRQPECRSLVKDTWLRWREVVDVEGVERLGVRVKERVDMRERGVEALLNVTAEDILVFKDEEHYEFQFLDSPSLPASLLISPSNDTSKHAYRRAVSIPLMRALPQKLLLIGSLFGHHRVWSLDPAEQAKLERIALALPFSSPHILEPAREIRAALGGSQAYVGAHARVGDGFFANEKAEKMRELWEKLMDRLEVGKKAKKEFLKLGDAPDSPPPPSSADLPTLPATNLTCRAPLHTSPTLKKLNVPLFLATDAPSPSADPSLRLFFVTFPCLFLLSDFNDLASVRAMKARVNPVDGVELGRLFLPFVEGTVAAMGREMVGTKGSTFSKYAETTLHRAFVTDVQKGA
ncbi:hypothetical protein JCM8097_003329 [Rhodosporidiobolus ruineniae]